MYNGDVQKVVFIRKVDKNDAKHTKLNPYLSKPCASTEVSAQALRWLLNSRQTLSWKYF